MTENQDRIYSNQGNPGLLDMLDTPCSRILDVGCGAGDNAALLKSRLPGCEIYGVTYSAAEAESAARHMAKCWVFDVEDDFPSDLSGMSFDAILFSHILEHTKDPAGILSRFSSVLRRGGQVLIAVPNILSWRMRLRFLFGHFNYEAAGVLDDTHLRFFTYFTADQYLLAKSSDLKLVDKAAEGSLPLWWLRRHILPRGWAARIDKWGTAYWPNLFSGQILIKAVKR